jgi:hypothetical protein
MEITLVRNATRKSRMIIYGIEGRPGNVQFTSKTLFDKDAVPATLRLTGEFAAPKVKETPAERKARLSAITPAERLAKMEARIAAMKAKLAAAPAAQTGAPTKAAANVARKAKK